MGCLARAHRPAVAALGALVCAGPPAVLAAASSPPKFARPGSSHDEQPRKAANVAKMPSRLPAVPRVGTFTLCLRPSTATAPSLLPVTQTASITREEIKERQRRDPYGWQQYLAKKSAFKERKRQIQEPIKAQFGDPVMGRPGTTPFLDSFSNVASALQTRDRDGVPIADSSEPAPTEFDKAFDSKAPQAAKDDPQVKPLHMRNHFLTEEEIEEDLAYFKALTEPNPRPHHDEDARALNRKDRKKHADHHEKAAKVIYRITALEGAGSKMVRHTNIQRCIHEFGRHNTEKTLPPVPKSIDKTPFAMPGRRGPDTGSSEVQISILTLKIRKLAEALAGHRGHRDKQGRRSLRLMVHRRQKLLKYMWRKEKDSPRWVHMMEKLGLSPANWKGEIVV